MVFDHIEETWLWGNGHDCSFGFPLAVHEQLVILGADRGPGHLRRGSFGSSQAASTSTAYLSVHLSVERENKQEKKTRQNESISPDSAQLWRFRCTPLTSSVRSQWPGPPVPASSVSGPPAPLAPPDPLPTGSGSLSHTSWLEAASSL